MEIKDLAKFLGLTEPEASMLDERAKSLGLDPVSGQINLIKRNKKERNEQGRDEWVTSYTFQIGIEGFRLIAERSGKYDGQDPIEYVVERDGVMVRTDVTLKSDTPVAAIAKVYRKDVKRPFVNIAHYRDYVGTTKDGHITAIWNKWTIMLPKCAEAGAFRKGFSELNLGKVYEAAEIQAEDLSNEEANTNGNGAGKPSGEKPPWAKFEPKPASAAPVEKTEPALPSAPEAAPVAPEAAATVRPTDPVFSTEQTAPAAPAVPETPGVAPTDAVDAPKPPEKMAVPSQKDAIMRLSVVKDTSSLGPVNPEKLTFKEASALIKQLNKLPLKKEAA